MKTEHPQEPTTRTGLEVYNKYGTWMIQNKNAYLALPGILIGIKYYEPHEGLNVRYSNSYVINIEHEYKNPDFLHSYEFVKHSGTYGYTLFAKTLKEAMIKAEQFIKQPFEGVRDFHTQEIVSHTRVSIKHIAKYAFLHHAAQFSDTLAEWKREPLEKDKELMKEYIKHVQTYENRRRSDEKYRTKIDNIFKNTFKMQIEDFVDNWHFKVTRFADKMKIKTLSDLPKFQEKVVRAAFKYYNI